MLTPSDRQWSLDAQHLDAQRLWPLSTGTGITVAVVDSGVDAHHADLTGRVLPGADFTGGATDGRVDLSSTAHGTAVAGIIAGQAISPARIAGLAPGVKILPIRISANLASEPFAQAQGIEYALEHGAKVINISITSPIANPQIKAAVAEAIAKDVVVVAAAGNEGQKKNLPQYPAALPGVVAVAAIDTKGQLWPESSSGSYVGLAAPGVDIYTAGKEGSSAPITGTSAAAPHVSAVVALLRAKFPTETANQIITRLTSTAHAPAAGRTPNWGFGVIDPYAALTLPAPDSDTVSPLAQPWTPARAADTPGPRTGDAWEIWTVGGALLLLAVGSSTFIWRRRVVQSKSQLQPRRRPK